MVSGNSFQVWLAGMIQTGRKHAALKAAREAPLREQQALPQEFWSL